MTRQDIWNSTYQDTIQYKMTDPKYKYSDHETFSGWYTFKMMNIDIFRIVNGEVIISGQIYSRNEGEQTKQEISF